MKPIARVTTLLVLTLAPAAVALAEPVWLRPSPDAPIPLWVKVDLKLGGDLSPERTGDELQANPAGSAPVALRARLAYLQQTLEDGRLLRRYDSVSVTPAGGKTTEALRRDRRLIVAGPTPGGPLAWSPSGALTRSEADLLQLAADPQFSDLLLPNKPVAEGDSWEIDPLLAAQLVALDNASVSELSAVMTGVTNGHARFRFAGAVHGRSDGAETQLDVRGVALFDRRAGRVCRLNIAVQADRAAGPVTPALNAGMKVNVSIDPAGPVVPFAADEIAQAATAEADTRLLVQAPDSDWGFLADRRWFILERGANSVRMRRLGFDKNDQPIVEAYATFRPLPSARQMTLSYFQSDVRQSLGSRGARLLASDQWTSPTGLDCLAIANEGKLADGAPVEWRHYHARTPGPESQAATLAITLPILPDRPALPIGRVLFDSLRLDEPVATAARDAARR